MKTLLPRSTSRIVTIILILLTGTLSAQVGINTTAPQGGSILDVTSTDKGVLVPRVSITNLSTIAPVTGGATESLLVYNTNTGTGKGFHYWDGAEWVALGGRNYWGLNGNAGTTAGAGDGNNFIGTTDAVDLILGTNDTEALTLTNNQRLRAAEGGSRSEPTYSFEDDIDTGIWQSANDRLNFGAGNVEFIEFQENNTQDFIHINDTGRDIDFRIETDNDPNTFFVSGEYDNVSIGINTPVATNKLEVYSGANDAIVGYSDNVGGVLGRESDISFGSPVQTVSGAGVYANNPFSGYTSIFAQSTGAADVGAFGAYSDVWIASYAYVDSNRDTYNPPASYSQLNINAVGLANNKAGIRSYVNRGTLANNGFISRTIGVEATSIAQNEETHGIYATAMSDYGNAVDGAFTSGAMGVNISYTGGVVRGFSMLSGYYLSTDFKVIGTGAVSTVVKDDSNQSRIMFAPEAPEVLFQDFGVGQLVNGQARINIDRILAKNITVDARHPLKVFIQLEGDCNGVYVTDKSKAGFTVKELQRGKSNISFSWQIVASRANRKAGNGMAESKFADQRFPVLNIDEKSLPQTEPTLMASNPRQ